ncbi:MULTISPECIES: hypothetical protein [unclassified Kribbella]|uniref:hypothetical protein n=1 Tax=unclassified Kribbella TaxID=2644121 RepID=UPI0033C17956
MGRAALAVAVVALLAGGCDDTPSGEVSPSPAPTTSTGEPSFDPTTPETTQPTRRQPAISIATAPIGGGSPREDGVKHCADVNWLGRNPLPAGTTLKLGTPTLDPTGVFELDQSACDGDEQPPCANVEWKTDRLSTCYVGARQVANSTRNVRLIIPIEATCETQDYCNSLVDDDQDRVEFEPRVLETPTTDPTTEPPTDPPTETPETPVETPSGG